MRTNVILICLALSFLLTSCKRQDSSLEPSATGQALERAQTEADKGNYSAALQTLAGALQEEKLAREEEIFTTLLEIMLEAGKLEEARERYLAATETDPLLAARAYGVISDHISKEMDKLELARWCGILIKTDLPPEVKYSAALKRNQALLAAGRFYAVLDSLPEYRSSLAADQFQSVMEKLYSQASAGRAGLLDRLNSYCSEQFPAHAGISELRTYMRVSALAKPDNDAATDVLLENFESFSDSYLSRSAKALLRVSLQKGATNNIARVCSRVYAEPEGIEKTARACAEPWLFVSKRNGDAAGIARKMKKLMSLDMESSFMYGLFRKYAYALMDMDDKKSISAGISVGNRILHRLDEPGKANRIKWALFDMNCYIERFPRAIEILDTIDDTSPEQIAMLKNKIAGHQAVAEGDWEEAVNSFRKFMDRIKEAEKDQFDPLSREVVPYEAVLGLNAKRIAGILEKHGQDSQARDAYREAKRYYGKALKSLTRQSPQRKRIKTVLAEIEEKLNQR